MPITIAEVIQIVIEIVKAKDEVEQQRRKLEEENVALRQKINDLHVAYGPVKAGDV